MQSKEHPMDHETMDTQATPDQPAETPPMTWTPAPVEVPPPARASRSRRAIAVLAGGALIALTIGASAAFASDPAGAPAGGTIQFDAGKADAAFTDFAACMRKNGVDMPDPVTMSGGPGGPGVGGATGVVASGTSIIVASGDAQAVPLDDAAFQAANDACSPILDAAGIRSGSGTIVGGEGSLNVGAAGSAGIVGITAGGDMTKVVEQFKTYAACMRSNGVDMPDPVADTKTGAVQLQFGSDPSSAAFQAANKTCDTGGFGFSVLPVPAQP
jgi:hypothetical protein